MMNSKYLKLCAVLLCAVSCVPIAVYAFKKAPTKTATKSTGNKAAQEAARLAAEAAAKKAQELKDGRFDLFMKELDERYAALNQQFVDRKKVLEAESAKTKGKTPVPADTVIKQQIADDLQKDAESWVGDSTNASLTAEQRAADGKNKKQVVDHDLKFFLKYWVEKQ